MAIKLCWESIRTRCLSYFLLRKVTNQHAIFYFSNLRDILYLWFIERKIISLWRSKWLFIILCDEILQVFLPPILNKLFSCLAVNHYLKIFVFLSPCKNFLVFTLWNHLVSSSRRRWAILSRTICLRSSLCWLRSWDLLSCLVFFFLVTPTQILSPST